MSRRARAPALTAPDRRAAIVAATLPLIKAHGANVTTSQIAQAAGIAEGTIFRVFPDKHALLLAALHSAMRADAEVDRIRGIPTETSLVERLVSAIAAIGDYQDRLWWLMRALQELGWQPARHALDADEASPRRQVHRIVAALAALFQPQLDSLRLEPAAAARILLALAFTNRLQGHGLGEPSATPAELVDLFLHGALRQPDGTPSPEK